MKETLLAEIKCKACGKKDYVEFQPFVRRTRKTFRIDCSNVKKRIKAPKFHINPIPNHKNPELVSGYSICTGEWGVVKIWRQVERA